LPLRWQGFASMMADLCQCGGKTQLT